MVVKLWDCWTCSLSNGVSSEAFKLKLACMMLLSIFLQITHCLHCLALTYIVRLLYSCDFPAQFTLKLSDVHGGQVWHIVNLWYAFKLPWQEYIVSTATKWIRFLLSKVIIEVMQEACHFPSSSIISIKLCVSVILSV